MVPLQLKDPWELFVKRREFLRCSRFLSRRDMTSADEFGISIFVTFMPIVANSWPIVSSGGNRRTR